MCGCAQESKLAPAVKSLMELIFDEKRMNDAIVEMKYDVKKLPLGKLTADQIKGSFAVYRHGSERVRAMQAVIVEENQMLSLVSCLLGGGCFVVAMSDSKFFSVKSHSSLHTRETWSQCFSCLTATVGD